MASATPSHSPGSLSDAGNNRITSSGPPDQEPTETDHPSKDIEKNLDGGTVQLTTSHASQRIPRSRAIALVITVTGAAFLNTLSVQAAVIVLPVIGSELSIPAARQQWIVSSYALAFGCFLLLWGRLADVYGKRPIFILGSLWVCVMTLICPFVPSEIGFNVLRGLQGLGAAANVPTAIGILGVTFREGKAKNYAFATYSAGAPLGSVFGNILGGIVAEYASWKWIFWILAIFAAALTVASHFVIPVPAVAPKEAHLKNAVDWVGGMMITIGVFALLFALAQGNVVGWTQPYIGTIIGLSLLAIIAFAFWQHHLETRTRRAPLMKISMFRNYRVSAAMLCMALFFAAFNNYLIMATFQFQDYQGLSPIQTTLRFIPTGVMGLLTILITSQILARVPVNYILMFGTLSVTTACLLFAVPLAPTTTYWAYGFPAMCLCVLGADTLFPSLVLFNSHNLAREDQALGGAAINAVGQIGRAIGLAIATAIQVAVQEARMSSGGESKTGDVVNKGNPAFLAGLRAAEWFNVAIALLAFVVSAVAFRGAGIIGKSKT